MKVTRRSAWIVGALAFLPLAGCESTTGPGEFDPVVTADAMAEMQVAGEEVGEAFAGLALAGNLFAGSGAQLMLPTAEHGVMMDVATARAYADPAVAADFFPSNYLGVTFVWNFAEEGYVASDEPGAPEDGIRVVYYAVDPFTHMPAEPLTALGRIDLRDLSTAASQRLGIAIVRTAGEDDVTLADYFLDASYTATETSFGVRQIADGYLSDGAARLDFELVNEMDLNEEQLILDQSYEMSLAGTDIGVAYEGTFTGDWETEAGTAEIAATVTGNGTSVRFELAVDAEEMLTGSVYHGSELVATISGTGDEPVFTNAATGEPLTAEQLEALAEIFRAVEGLFELAEGIFPAV